MYIPASFAETDPATLHAFIDRHSFATLVSHAGGEPFATHLPLLLDRDRGSHGFVVGHLARANPQWQTAAGQRVLAIFSGPHTYISPGWYEAENVVPTWNYVAVHVYGTFRVMEDRSRTLELLRRMVERYESSQTTPWKLESQDAAYVDRMIDGIVAFEIEIDRIEGKWKLSQNQPPERREKVLRQLQTARDPDAKQIADLMQL